MSSFKLAVTAVISMLVSSGAHASGGLPTAKGPTSATTLQCSAGDAAQDEGTCEYNVTAGGGCSMNCQWAYCSACGEPSIFGGTQVPAANCSGGETGWLSNCGYDPGPGLGYFCEDANGVKIYFKSVWIKAAVCG